MTQHRTRRTGELFNQVFAVTLDEEAWTRADALRVLSGKTTSKCSLGLVPMQWLARQEIADALTRAAGPHLLVHTRQDIQYWTIPATGRGYSLAVTLHTTAHPRELELEAHVKHTDGTIIAWLNAHLLLVSNDDEGLA